MSPTRIPFQPSLPLRAWPGAFGDDGEAAAEPAGGAGRRVLGGKRVLLVEDEAMLAIELQFALEDAGAVVLGPALSLSEALTLLDRHDDIDGAVLDVNLSGQSVIPLAHSLARTGVPILFNTGHADRAELLALFPAADVLAKPNSPGTLTGHLAALIARTLRN